MKKLLLTLFLFTFIFSFSQEERQIVTDSTKTEEVLFAIIENVPLYKGCDENMTNRAKKQCMDSKVSDLISNNFNSEIANDLGLPIGNVRILVTYMIDKEGNVINIKAKAPHPKLEEEAIRVIKLIPQMEKAGHQRGKPVIVPYSLPILFKVDNKKEKKKSKKKNIVITPDKFPVHKRCNENLNYEDQKKCTTKKIMNFIKVSFDYEMADRVFQKEQSTRFKVNFIINKKGKVEQINAQANHKAVAIEIIRIMKRLPKFKKPGYLNGKPVNVPFSFLMTIYF